MDLLHLLKSKPANRKAESDKLELNFINDIINMADSVYTKDNAKFVAMLMDMERQLKEREIDPDEPEIFDKVRNLLNS